MKASEFRKLIREEVRKVLKEAASGTLRNVEAETAISSDNKDIKTLFGQFVTVRKQQDPDEEPNFATYIVDLNIDNLLNVLQTNKTYNVQTYYDRPKSVTIWADKNNSLEFSNLPKDVIQALVAVGTPAKPAKTYMVSVYIGADPYANFDDFEDYSLPDIAVRTIGMPKITAAPETSAEANQIDRYVAKLEKTLLAAANKVVPGIQSMGTEEGAILFQLPGEPDSQMKSKLKSLFKGAKKVAFN
jgi:hypothetical protein